MCWHNFNFNYSVHSISNDSISKHFYTTDDSVYVEDDFFLNSYYLKKKDSSNVIPLPQRPKFSNRAGVHFDTGNWASRSFDVTSLASSCGTHTNT